MIKTDEWKKIIQMYPEANFLQSPGNAKMNEILGEKVVSAKITGGSGKIGHALMIVRDAKRGRYLEIACGPLIDWKDQKMVEDAMKVMTKTAKKENCVFIRIRPQLSNIPENQRLMRELGFRKAPMHLAAEHTVIVDLDVDEDELLKRMRRQTRYEVRRAGKLGIKVTSSNSEGMFKEFHTIQAETAKRQNFVPPNLKTLMAEREAFSENITIYKAETPEGEAIAYGLVIRDGVEGDYYEAASTDLNRKMPGAYAVLWQAMRDLREAGYMRFNLWGIAPADQPNHRYAGVTTFKTGFGGTAVEYIPAQDLVISKVRYLKDLIVEEARKKRRHL